MHIAASLMAMTTKAKIENRARLLLAKNLRQLRLAKGWSQEELADLANFHRTYVSQLERGITNVTIDNLQRLAEVLGIEIPELFIQP